MLFSIQGVGQPVAGFLLEIVVVGLVECGRHDFPFGLAGAAA